MSFQIIEKIINDISNSNLTIEQVMGLSVSQWVKDNNEEKLRINFYKTKKYDIILDIGSYDGAWANQFLNKHHDVKMHCYEPSKNFYSISLKNLNMHINKNKVKIENYGLSNKNSISTIDDTLGLAASVGSGIEEIQLIDISTELLKFHEIFLLKMNIEGEEYNCIPRLIETGHIKKIKNLQIQFHPLKTKDETLKKYIEIAHQLSETHYIDYFFPFIWENWSLKQ